MENRSLLFCLTLLLLIQLISSSEVLRPRGVPLSRKVFYDPRKDFTCIDGSASIPFIFVNDDYCDCNDASDEPGTSACPNGLFHCPNKGYFEKVIPSSRVNDGICDCCDASDEYNSSVTCADNCMELGESAREEFRKQQELFKQGSEVRTQYIKEAKTKKKESEDKLSQLKRELLAIEGVRNEKESLKKTAEEKEKAALDKHLAKLNLKQKQSQEEEMKKAQDEDQKLAEEAFRELDSDGDEILSYTELQDYEKFDQNNDGIVSDDEAKFFLHMKDEMNLSEFATTGWIIMKPYYMKDREHETTSTPKEPVTDIPDLTNLQDEESLSLPSEPINDESEDEEDEPEEPPLFPQKDANDEFTNDKKPEQDYDQETKNLIEEAKQAKQEFNEADGKYADIQRKIRELEVLFETDFGNEDEFMPMNGHCFEHTDREYTYKFCPFDKASQRPKDGGAETNLGRWGSWSGTEPNKYSIMKMDSGAQCWNGPARSVEIYFNCGLNNQLLSASEPSRCEYRFDFETPAMCVVQSEQQSLSDHEHTEL